MADDPETATETLTGERAAGAASPSSGSVLSETPSTNGKPPGDGNPPAGQGGDQPAGPRRGALRSRRLRWIVIPILIIVAVVAAIFGANYYLTNLWYVSTDNAQVTGTPVPVGTVNAGTVEQIPVQVGQSVSHGQLLATVLLPLDANSAPVRKAITAPFDSVVIDIPVGVGSTVTPGQGIVVVVDPSTVYVNANISEDDVKRVAPGQPVDVHIDALNTTIPGTVESITPASAATFSLLPQNNSSGSFTKVTQLVPVKIGIDASQGPLPVGTSAEVKIHVAPGH